MATRPGRLQQRSNKVDVCLMCYDQDESVLIQDGMYLFHLKLRPQRQRHIPDTGLLCQVSGMKFHTLPCWFWVFIVHLGMCAELNRVTKQQLGWLFKMVAAVARWHIPYEFYFKHKLWISSSWLVQGVVGTLFQISPLCILCLSWSCTWLPSGADYEKEKRVLFSQEEWLSSHREITILQLSKMCWLIAFKLMWKPICSCTDNASSLHMSGSFCYWH